MESIVLWFNDEKGFGFIEFKGKEIFIHYSTIQQEYISFGLVKTSKGLKAKNIISR